MSARSRELLGLVPVSLMLCAGFLAILLVDPLRAGGQAQSVELISLTYGAFFLGLCLLAHIFIRARLPDADPYMFPLVALLAAFGLVMIYRIDEELAREQAQWFVVGLVFFCATILLLRDIRVMERYRYTIAFAGIVLLVLPRVPGIGEQVNGAYLGIRVGPIGFQTAELAKIAIIIFLASYLNDTREVLVRGRIPRISPRHFGPLLVVWGASMLLLVFIRDLGSSLMFFGAFLALVYVATARISFVLAGLALFVAGFAFFANTLGHVEDRVDTWRHPFSTERVYCPAVGAERPFIDCQGHQIAQSLFAQADGGLFGKGFGEAVLEGIDGRSLLPAPHTDLIYAVITNELGLFGASAVLLVYLLFAFRGFVTAAIATDGFSKLLATGLTAVLALQVFVIVGGVTKVIPLTGVTLPFISYGGSSIVANCILLALLLIVSDRARREPETRGGLV
jgi:cell division protein FtsW (lipid II flippase)